MADKKKITDRRKVLVLDGKSFLQLCKRDHPAVDPGKLLNSIRKAAKLQIFRTMNLFVMSDKEVMKFAIWQWKRIFICNDEKIRLHTDAH